MCFVYFMLISILNFYIFYFKSFFLFKKNHLCIVYFEFSFPGLKNLTYWSTPDYEKANSYFNKRRRSSSPTNILPIMVPTFHQVF